MVNMRMLIRIVFIIFIANGIDCLGGVCDDCCDCLKEKKEKEKKEYVVIKEYENITAEFLVSTNWYNTKEKTTVLMIFKKEDDNVFTSEGNVDKISIKLEGEDNTKIAYLQKKEDKDPLNLGGKKYALFKIETNTNKTEYLYCSDVESSEKDDWGYGIFEWTHHVSISVIACDTENVKNMRDMFNTCTSLEELNLKIFNTENVTNMKWMFCNCSNLTELNLKNFNTSNVTDMAFMFAGCSNLKELEIVEKFNTEKVTRKENMFYECNNLHDDIKNKF